MKHLIEFGLVCLGLLALAGLVIGDEDSERHDRIAQAPANAEYQAECGSCHLAYPPGLLPARAWDGLMAGLADHFGDNAELPADSAARILDHLRDNAAGRRFSLQSQQQIPLRISETTWFRHEHDEVPKRLVQANPEVRSFSNCQACHPKAESASFNEHRVDIPGYGRWDD